MSCHSTPASKPSTHHLIDHVNAAPRGRRFSVEDHQYEDLDRMLIHEDDKSPSPRSTNAFGDNWDESPTAKGLLLHKSTTAALDQAPTATSSLFQRPTSAGNMLQPTMFCFKPAHKPKQLQLGRQGMKMVHDLEAEEKAVDDRQTVISILQETSEEPAENDLDPVDITGRGPISICEKPLPFLKQNAPTHEIDATLERKDNLDEPSVKTSPTHSCRSTVGRLDCIPDLYEGSKNCQSSASQSDPQEVVDKVEQIDLTSISTKSGTHTREVSQVTSRSDDMSASLEHVEPCKMDSIPLYVDTMKRHQTRIRGKQHATPSGIVKTPKSPRSPQSPQSVVRRFSELPTKEFHSENIPTQEDLLYLLMSRTRETTKSMQKLEILEQQNRKLCEERIVTDARLEEAESARLQLSGKQAVMDQCLQNFKEKYYKLKSWALEANKDCEVLQTKSVDFQKAITELAIERNDVRKRLEDLNTVHENDVHQMDRMRILIKDVRQMAADQAAIASRKEALLQGNNECLRKEQARCEKLEAHIAQIERHKHRQDQRFQDERDEQKKSLQELFCELKKLTAKGAESQSESREILEGVRLCQSFVLKEPTFISELSQIKGHFEAITQLINLRSTSAIESLKGELDTLGKIFESRTTTESQQSLQAVQESNVQLVKAREKVAQLLQANEQSQTIMDLLRNGKEVAESREAYLKTSTEKLIEVLTNGKGNHQEHQDQLQNSNEALLTKFQAASSQAAEYKGQNDEMSRQIKLLGIQLGDLQKEKDGIVERLQTSVQELLLVKERSRVEMGKKIYESDDQLRRLRADLTEQTQLRQHSERHSKEINTHLSKVQQQLKNAESQSVLTAHEKDEQTKHIASLQHELAKARANVNLFDQTQRDLAAKSAEVVRLVENQSKYEKVKQELLVQQQKALEKTREAELLQSHVEDLHRQSLSLEQKVREKEVFAELNVCLGKEAHDLKQKLAGLQSMKDQLEKQHTQLEESRSALDLARKDLCRMQELEGNNKPLSQKLNAVSFELITANEKNQSITALEGNNKTLSEKLNAVSFELLTANKKNQALTALEELLAQKEETIRRREAELETHASVSAELIKTKEDVEVKQIELSRLEARVLTLESEQATIFPHQPLRRAANRSTESAAHPLQNHSRPDLQFNDDETGPNQATVLLGVDSSIPPTGSLNMASTPSVIPDTQVVVQQRLQEIPNSFQSQLHILETLGLQDSGDTSSLTDIADPFSEDEFGGNEEVTYLEEPEGSPHPSHGVTTAGVPAGPSQPVVERPPSSSYGSLNEHMLLDFSLNGETQPGPTGRNDKNNSDPQHVEHLRQGKTSKRTGPTSRRLRSVSQPQRGPSTDSPENRLGDLGDRESTPLIAREKHQPNSAVKRKIEQSESQQSSKQLKRTPANLEVSIPRTSQGTSQRGEKSPPRRVVTFRRSSVVGTNAPAPEKSQKTSKSARRGSRQERYSSRFGKEG